MKDLNVLQWEKQHGRADSETLCRREVSYFKRLFPDMGNANDMFHEKGRFPGYLQWNLNFVKYICMYVCVVHMYAYTYECWKDIARNITSR